MDRAFVMPSIGFYIAVLSMDGAFNIRKKLPIKPTNSKEVEQHLPVTYNYVSFIIIKVTPS